MHYNNYTVSIFNFTKFKEWKFNILYNKKSILWIYLNNRKKIQFMFQLINDESNKVWNSEYFVPRCKYFWSKNAPLFSQLQLRF